MARLHFRGHIGKRDYALNTVAPTFAAAPIVGIAQSGTLGTWTPVESAITGYAIQIQGSDAPDYTNWTDIAGATSLTWEPTSGEIGKKLRLGVAAKNGDDEVGTQFVYSSPTAPVQDAPAVPLSITGTPVTSANQGDVVTFTVSFDGGSGTYTPSLLNAPSGSTVTLLTNGDQATVSLSTANVGSFGNIIVRVSDGISTADRAPFTFTVNAIGSIQTVAPGAGWSGLTTSVNGVSISTRRGSAGVGYNGAPTIRIEEPPFMDIDSPYILWIHTYHVGPLGAYDPNDPTFGIEKVTVAADGGAWLTIFAQYNAAEDFWGFPVRINPASWADGYPTLGTSSVRTLRIVSWPINGMPQILQGEPPGYSMAFRFTTNAGGTFTRAKRYFGANGNSGNDGLTSSTPKATMEQARATFTPGGGRDYGDLELVCTGGTSLSLSLNTSATTVRPLRVSALPGLTPSQCIFSSQGGGGLNTKMQHIKGVSIAGVLNTVSGSALFSEDVAMDGGAANSQLNNTWHSAGFTGGVWTKGGSITNYGNAFISTRSVVKTHTITCSRNWINNVLFLRGATLGSIPESGGYHPDLFQYFKNPTNVAGDGWQYGAIAINCSTEASSAQGPFFKDNEYIGNIYMIGCNFDISLNATRNSYRVNVNTFPVPAFPKTILRNSMFWNTSIVGGNGSRGGGQCVDVIWKNMDDPGSPEAGTLVYEAA